MMRPFWSLVVSFWYCSFHVTTCTAPVGQKIHAYFTQKPMTLMGTKNESDDLRLHHLCFVLSSYHYVLQVSGSLRGYWVPQVLSILHHLQTTDYGLGGGCIMLIRVTVDKALIWKSRKMGKNSIPVWVSSFRTFKSPSSPPHAMKPWSLFHDTHFNLMLFGIAICKEEKRCLLAKISQFCWVAKTAGQ